MGYLSAYISYRRKAVNQYGLHSPFMYKLYLEVFKPKWKKEELEEPNALRKKLLHDQRVITVTDLGAGSKKFKSNQRKIAAIAATSVKKKKYARLLSRLIKYTQATHVVELGTSLGISTVYLSRSTNGKVYTLEGCPAIFAEAVKNITGENCVNTECIQGNFTTTLPALLTEIANVDAAFIDGWHTYEGTMFCFNTLVHKINANGIVIIDDIHWSEEMEKAWNEIQRHSAVTATIDIFEMGIVFFNPALTRETFYLKY